MDGGGDPGRRGRVADAERADPVEEPGQFADEERVAGGTGVDGAGDGVAGILARLVADEFGHVRRTERPEPEPAVAGPSARGGQHPGEVRAEGGRAVAQRADERRALGQPPRQMLQQLEGGDVGPLEVVEDQEGRPPRRGLSDEGDDLFEQPELGVAVGEFPAGVLPRPEEAAQPAREPLFARRGGQTVHDLAECLLPRPHRRGPLALQAGAPDGERTQPARHGGGLLQQPRLARTRFALDDADRAVAGERALHQAPQRGEFLRPADQGGPSGLHLPVRIPHRRRRRGLREDALLCVHQPLTRVDAELLGEPVAGLAEHRQRLRLAAAGAENADEGGQHGLVERRHRRGQLQRREHSLRVARRHGKSRRPGARVVELVVECGEDRRGERPVGDAVACRAVPEPEGLDVVIESRLVLVPGQRGPGGFDEFPEGDEVQNGGARDEEVGIAAPVEERAGFTDGQRRLQQPSQRADVLLEDVESRRRDVLGPDQVDQFARGDRLARAGEQEREQVRLLPRAGVQFDAVPPDPHRTENLQTQRHGGGSHSFSHSQPWPAFAAIRRPWWLKSCDRESDYQQLPGLLSFEALTLAGPT